ncbi:Endonuclease, Uma2 family (restriction endonuclease fold) [Azospirillum oryzae]|uniref:Endonuclease, Uma2 family (Restriction endonuclease fold) n=1 Tax=Azospirillum oryzae TaxID=286727 RepID=A0A1X7GPY4_9PROT|nr:Uma2 family endonuclease [Azospirillum oryzae]SMF72829.1 Endonuclease, Uma2 family (restriction endonuclease fold) [Azospirillum oryzae]
MALRKQRLMTLDEFLAWEERQDGRHEFLQGEIVAMVGGTVAHNQISGNIYAALRADLRGSPCRVFQETMRILADESVFYPDVFVTCAALDDRDRLATAPTVIVEVLSDSTSSYDHTTKSAAYRTLPSLTQYVLVHQRVAVVESFRRTGDGWTHELISGREGALSIPALEVTLPLSAIYEDTRVSFDLTIHMGDTDDA